MLLIWRYVLFPPLLVSACICEGGDKGKLRGRKKHHDCIKRIYITCFEENIPATHISNDYFDVRAVFFVLFVLLKTVLEKFLGFGVNDMVVVWNSGA